MIYGHNEIRNKPFLIHSGNKISSNLNVFAVKDSVLFFNFKLSKTLKTKQTFSVLNHFMRERKQDGSIITKKENR